MPLQDWIFRAMTERLTSDSFLIRVYRVDTENCRNITGVLEAMDGTHESKPFTDIDELGAMLYSRTDRTKKKPKEKIRMR